MTVASGPLVVANADLMDPLAEILRASDKDLPTKVGVLVDLAGALLATSERMHQPSELRLTADEMRKRLIQATRLHQAKPLMRVLSSMRPYNDNRWRWL